MSIQFNATDITYTFKDNTALIIGEYGTYAVLDNSISVEAVADEFKAMRDGLFIARQYSVPVIVKVRRFVEAEEQGLADGDEESDELEELAPLDGSYAEPEALPYIWEVQLIGNVQRGSYRIRFIGKMPDSEAI